MGIINSSDDCKVTIIASHKSWIDSEAIEQLENIAGFDGMCLAVGLPDLHPGKEAPIGAAFVSQGWVYPHLVGNDIGCGMALWQTDLVKHKIKLEKWTNKLTDLENVWDGDLAVWLDRFGLESTKFNHSMGTIGGGNHFAELQSVEEVFDSALFSELEIDTNKLYLLVHSGSRGIGEDILSYHTKIYQNKGLQLEEDGAGAYIKRHDYAVKWAHANRALISERFLNYLGARPIKKVLDINHNTVSEENIGDKKYWIHRKGAAPSNFGPVIIPGSRGSLSYLVQPIGDQENNAYSLAHGAGRKWTRSDARGKLRKYKKEDFVRTDLGSRVICEDKNLIYEEAPEAYKKIDTIISDLIEYGLIKVIASLRPVITYKTRRRL